MFTQQAQSTGSDWLHLDEAALIPDALLKLNVYISMEYISAL